MRSERPRSLNSLLSGPGSRLGDLARRAAARAELCRRVRDRLPADLAGHVVHVSDGTGGQAVVTVDSAAWATRLHYDQEQLLAAMRAEGLQVRQLTLRVAPPTA